MEFSFAHHSQEQLVALERFEKDASRSKRIVILAMQGWTAPAIAMAVGLTRRGCQEWMYRDNEPGLPGLDDRRGQVPGVPLNEADQRAFRQRLEDGPLPEDKVCSLRGRDDQRILQQEFDITRSLSSIECQDKNSQDEARFGQ